MEIEEVSPSEYKKYFNNPLVLFNSVEFAELNKDKADSVHYLLFKDSKVRLGLILGKMGNEVRSPFSAPFGGFVFLDPEVKALTIAEAIQSLETWLLKSGVKKITLSLPPIWYANGFFTRLINCLFADGYLVDHLEVNHQFFVPRDFDQDYRKMLYRNAKKNLNNALKNDLIYIQLGKEQAKRAYEVIAVNRKEKGKPLRMSYQQVMETSNVIPVDFFLVTKDDLDIAAAIVFQINHNTAYVTYWGDNPAYTDLRSMNFLSFNVFRHYAEKSFHAIDIGISTEFSKPNFGLCEFKESLGCSVSIKYTLSKSF